MPPQKGKSQPADVARSQLGYMDEVTPLAWNDPHAGSCGSVRRTVLRGGDIEVTVQFPDGIRRDYWEDELKRMPHKPSRSHDRYGNWAVGQFISAAGDSTAQFSGRSVGVA